MNTNAKDPLLLLSILLAVAGAIQASTGHLSALAAQYPVGFGLAVTATSITTAVLTVLKNYAVAAAAAAPAVSPENRP